MAVPRTRYLLSLPVPSLRRRDRRMFPSWWSLVGGAGLAVRPPASGCFLWGLARGTNPCRWSLPGSAWREIHSVAYASPLTLLGSRYPTPYQWSLAGCAGLALSLLASGPSLGSSGSRHGPLPTWRGRPLRVIRAVVLLGSAVQSWESAVSR